MTRIWILLALCACTRPSEERALADLEVGRASTSGTSVEVDGGLAAIHELGEDRLELYASAPAIEMTLTVDAQSAGTWTIVARNVLPDALLYLNAVPIARGPSGSDDRPTVATFTLEMPQGPNRLRIAPPDAETREPFRVASMADIQTGMPSVHEVFEAISAVPDARFVVAMGDITERAEQAEYELFLRQLEHLDIPFYSTIGNHELWGDHHRWLDRFGRMSYQFDFKGVAFTFVDTGDAGIDPLVEDWLAGWLAAAADRTHVFLTHIPPVDPVGTRYGSFRSTRDGRRLLSQLLQGGVDLTLYGHIHTLVEFENAGIPAYVSGGGGAEPMKLDGIDRHFLMIELDAAGGGVGPVDVVEVD